MLAGPVSTPPAPMAAALAAQGIRWVAITWVNHAGAPLVKVVPLAGLEAAAAVGVGFSPVADAFGADGGIADGGIAAAHRLARPDGDLRLRADAVALAPLEPASGWAWAPGERFERSGEPYETAEKPALATINGLLLPGNPVFMGFLHGQSHADQIV